MKKNLKNYSEDHSPMYLQLYERLRNEITSGIYPCGSRFLSKRTLADHYGVSLITVEHSLTLLLEEGYLESRERSGFFVAYKEGDLFTPIGSDHIESAAAQEIAGLSSAPSSESPESLFPFSSYARIMRKVITERGEMLLHRVPHEGAAELRRAISEYLARSRGLRVKPDQIFIGAGSEYFYGVLVQYFGRSSTFAIEQPSYEKIELVYRANEANLELLPLGKDGIRSAALSASCADVLHITPYRSYPSGISTSAAKRRAYVRWAEIHDSYIIEDDFESEFTPSRKPEETVFSLSKSGRVLYLNSFTRTISPATRISYLVLPENLVKPFEKRLGFYACTVPAFDQYVLAEFMKSGEFERHINRVRRRRRTEIRQKNS